MSFLDSLSLAPDEREKLQSLGAKTPAALLGQIRIARNAFVEFVGPNRADAIEQQLDSMLTKDERTWLTVAPREFQTGALIGPPPGLPPATFDIERRDRLFEELQSLKQRSHFAKRERDRISELEEALRSMLEIDSRA